MLTLYILSLEFQRSTVHPIESNIESNSTMAGMSAFLHIRTVSGSGTFKRLLGHRAHPSRMS